jgi:VanZ family protein
MLFQRYRAFNAPPMSYLLFLRKPVWIRYKTLTLLWALVILILTLLPSDKLPKTPSWDTISFDKVAHAGVFALLIFLMSGSFWKQSRYRFLREYPAFSSLLISVLFGIGVEILQTVLGWGRDGSLLDVVSNTIGCLIGIGAFYVAKRLRWFNLG